MSVWIKKKRTTERQKEDEKDNDSINISLFG